MCNISKQKSSVRLNSKAVVFAALLAVVLLSSFVASSYATIEWHQSWVNSKYAKMTVIHKMSDVLVGENFANTTIAVQGGTVSCNVQMENDCLICQNMTIPCETIGVLGGVMKYFNWCGLFVRKTFIDQSPAYAKKHC